MALRYTDNPAAFRFEILNLKTDIGKWTFQRGKTITDGKGMIDFLTLCSSFSADEVAVIYVKDLRVFELISENYIALDKPFFATGSLKFYWIQIKENIELRSWDEFDLEDTSDTNLFLERLDKCNNVFKGRNKTKGNLKNHYNYGLAKEMWWDISQYYHLDSYWANAWRQAMLPKSEEELNLYYDLNKSGFFMINKRYVGDTVNNVHSYDASSNHISLMARKYFPYEEFKREEDAQKKAKIILSGFYSWIGRIVFEEVDQKVKIPVNLSKFGERIGETDFLLILNDVDFEWFKKIFTWKNIDIEEFYYSKKKPLAGVNIDIAHMLSDLYENKEAMPKGTPERNLMKFRAELPYGRSIQSPVYCSEAVYIESLNTITKQYRDQTFKDAQRTLGGRKALPYQIGLWTVSYSRLELINLIIDIGPKNVVYCDTDCIKFVGDEGIEIVEKKNKEIDEEFRKIKKKYQFSFHPKFGKWKDEGTCTRFKAIGIKWYMYEVNGELKVKACGADKDNLKSFLEKQPDPFRFFSREMRVNKLFKQVEYLEDERAVKIRYYNYLNKRQVDEFEIYESGTIAMLKKEIYRKGDNFDWDMDYVSIKRKMRAIKNGSERE